MDLDIITLRNLNGARIGVSDAACPLCGPHCRTPANQKRKVLRIWDDGGFLTYKCARCEASGWAKDGECHSAAPRPKPVEHSKASSDKSELARFLWDKSLPATGSPVEVYLRSRHCWHASPNIRFLPARNEHPPAMIARFGDGIVTGVHLTKLKSDGSGKAGTEKDKLMIGPSVGQPIIVHDNPEGASVLIAEGIEDAASLAIATGWTALAAGSAGRIASVLAFTKRYDSIFVAIDRDQAGRAALERARAMRGDIIPLRLWRVLPMTDATDANRALVVFGPDALLASIELCEAQSRHARGLIGFNAMQSATMRAHGVFRLIAGDGAGL